MKKETAFKLEAFRKAELPKTQQKQVVGGSGDQGEIIVIDSVDT